MSSLKPEMRQVPPPHPRVLSRSAAREPDPVLAADAAVGTLLGVGVVLPPGQEVELSHLSTSGSRQS